MNPTRVAVLTPPGAGAIATVEVSGPRAWDIARQLFRPAGKPLPETPELHRFWFGTLGGDEVILAVTGPETVEVHCHGGVRVVRWVVEQFTALGCVAGEPIVAGSIRDRLAHAPTLRTASILLDQLHGAFERAVERVLAILELPVGRAVPDTAGHVGHSPTYEEAGNVGHSPTYEEARALLREPARYAPVGRHLVEPWKVVVAGAPNVGKSSLVNALAGFQRAVVSDIAGTTRDVVSVAVAFDGWPVELIDTAGLREAEGLEAAGVDLANRALAEADLVLWVVDRTEPSPRWPSGGELAGKPTLFIANKADLPAQWSGQEREALAVSATTGAGLGELVAAIVQCLVPDPPPTGAAVPYSAELAAFVQAANAALAAGHVEECVGLLRDCLGESFARALVGRAVPGSGGNVGHSPTYGDRPG